MTELNKKKTTLTKEQFELWAKQLTEQFCKGVEYGRNENKDINKDIKKIVGYLWYDENKHFVECDKPKNHIFVTLKRLNKKLNLGFKEEKWE